MSSKQGNLLLWYLVMPNIAVVMGQQVNNPVLLNVSIVRHNWAFLFTVDTLLLPNILLLK